MQAFLSFPGFAPGRLFSSSSARIPAFTRNASRLGPRADLVRAKSTMNGRSSMTVQSLYLLLVLVIDGAKVDHAANRPAVKRPPSDPAA